MVDSVTLQESYKDIYKQVRDYILPFPAVEALANLEIEIFKAFPDALKLPALFRRFKDELRMLGIREDEDLDESICNMDELLEEAEDFCHKISQVNEVVE